MFMYTIAMANVVPPGRSHPKPFMVPLRSILFFWRRLAKSHGTSSNVKSYAGKCIVHCIFLLCTVLLDAFPDIEYLHNLHGQQGAWSVSASDYATCAVVNSSVECFGVNSYQNALPDKIGPWSTASVGAFMTCGIQYSGLTECWGFPWEGENMLKPPTDQLCDLDVALYHACGIKTDGTIECWGGDKTNTDEQSPKEWLPYGNRIFVQVSTSAKHTCAVFNDGAAQCIGDNTYLQAPIDPVAEENGEDDREIKFPEVGNGYMHISAGAYHTCVVLYDGGMECWGRNDYQQAPPERFYPIRKTKKFIMVSCGVFHCCAIRDDGAAECWGQKSARCSAHWHATSFARTIIILEVGKNSFQLLQVHTIHAPWTMKAKCNAGGKTWIYKHLEM